MCLRDRLSFSKLEFECDGLPGSLHFPAHDPHDTFQNLLFDAGNLPTQIAALACSAEQQVDHRERYRQIQLQYSLCSGWHQIAGTEIGNLGKALQEFPIRQMLRRNQPAVEHNT